MFVTPVLAVCRKQIFGRLITHQLVNLNEMVRKNLKTRSLPSRGEHKFKKFDLKNCAGISKSKVIYYIIQLLLLFKWIYMDPHRKEKRKI